MSLCSAAGMKGKVALIRCFQSVVCLLSAVILGKFNLRFFFCKLKVIHVRISGYSGMMVTCGLIRDLFPALGFADWLYLVSGSSLLEELGNTLRRRS
jgi:hypothetical protein